MRRPDRRRPAGTCLGKHVAANSTDTQRENPKQPAGRGKTVKSRMRPSLIVASLAVMTIDVVAAPPRHEAASRSIARTSTESSSSTHPSQNVPPPEASRMSDAEGATKVRIADAYGKLPLGFEANYGQTDADVQF